MGPGVKYRPWDTVPTNTSLIVNAARGQWVSFQIACKVSNEDVSGVDVSVTTPTSGSFSLKAPIIYKEVTYNVIKKSRDDGVVGEWPDPLIPKVDQCYSERRNAFPFKVNRVSPVYNMFDFNIASSNPVTRNNGAKIKPTISGTYSGSSPLNYHIKMDSKGSLEVVTFKWSDDGGTSWKKTGIRAGSNVQLNNGLLITFPNQTYSLNDEWEFFANASRTEMVWVECYIPTDAIPSNYTSQVTVSANGKTNQTLSVTINVYNVTIPKTSSIPVYYISSRDTISNGHYQVFQSTQHEALYKRYVEAGLKHRISVTALAPYLTWDGTNITNWAVYKDWMSPYINGKWGDGSALTAFKASVISGMLYSPMINVTTIREKDLTTNEKKFLTALAALINAEGWMSKNYIHFIEEPIWTASAPPAAMTDAIIAGAGSIHLSDSGYKTMATKRYVSQWANGPVDVWISLLKDFEVYPRSIYNSEVVAGRQVWSYLTCMSKGCNITGGAILNKWPSVSVDAILPNLRGYYWLMFDNDIRGDLYWQVTAGYRYYNSIFSSPSAYDPWDSHFDYGGDGEGTYFYPGRPDRIGGTTHIPIESLRLKAIRMGLEDYEIFKYASDRGYSSYVKTQIDNAVGKGKYYYTSPHPSNTAMETARNNILSLFGRSTQSGVAKTSFSAQ
jgi:hypothetical protein